MSIRAGDIAEAVGGRITGGSAERLIGRAIIDSRNSCRDCLFFALKGSSTDGHLFVDDILANHGVAVVSRGDVREGVILVESVEKALLDAARWRRSRLGSRIIAITGSSGKTTTRLFLRAALECRYRVYSTRGNLNNHLGMPLTLLNVPEDEPDVVILELGMNHPGELLLLGEIAAPSDSLITNVGRAHMEFFNSVEDIARAKSELLQTTAPGGTCVIPVDEEILKRTAHENGLSIRYFGDGGDAWFVKEQGRYIVYPWKMEMNLQFKGDHNILNAISAILMADTLNVQPEIAIEAVSGVTPAKGRGRVVRAEGLTILDESYNANPDSTAACLDVLEAVEGSKGAILGDMRELGEGAPEFHTEILRKADGIGLDFIILTGDLYDSVKSTAINTTVFMAEDWKDALKILRRTVSPDCTVLVKGSNSLKLSELVRSLEEGS